MKYKPVVHVGFPKCASTFLQKQIFPNLNTYKYYSDARREIDKIIRNYYPQLDEVPWIMQLKGQRAIISLERLLGFIYSPVVKADKAIDAGIINIYRYLGSDVSILVIIRRQDDIVLSRLRHKHKNYSKPEDLFLDFPVSRGLGGTFRFKTKAGLMASCLDYYSRIMPLVYLFGKENVHVLVYEDLIEDPEKFFGVLSQALDEDVSGMITRIEHRENISPRKMITQNRIIQKCNLILGKRLEYFLPKREILLSDESREEIMCLYKENNRRLSDFFSIDLKRYEYY